MNRRQSYRTLLAAALLVSAIGFASSGLGAPKDGGAARAEAPSPALVFVVRHAEKIADPKLTDPGLSEKGVRRAADLARVLGSAGLGEVWTTPFERTRKTAAPAAKAAGVEPREYDPKDPAAHAATLLAGGKGGAALVVGHSNTVPATLKALGVKDEILLTDGDYDDLFCVAIGAGGAAQLIRLHYGEASD